jgi:hypothetical protein
MRTRTHRQARIGCVAGATARLVRAIGAAGAFPLRVPTLRTAGLMPGLATSVKGYEENPAEILPT